MIEIFNEHELDLLILYTNLDTADPAIMYDKHCMRVRMALLEKLETLKNNL